MWKLCKKKKCGALKPTYVCINILGFPCGAVYDASEERADMQKNVKISTSALFAQKNSTKNA